MLIDAASSSSTTSNKAIGLDALRRVSGSTAIVASARHVISMARHPDDETKCVAVVSKTNLGPKRRDNYEFTLEPIEWKKTDLTDADILATIG